jgi:glucose/arabinose dehydrogenase
MGVPFYRLTVVVALLSAMTVVLLPQGAARAGVTSVSAGAYGYYTNVGFSGGPQSVRGHGQSVPPGDAASASPSVTLPSAGGSQTTTDPDGADAVYGPAHIFESHGPMTVHTEGTTGGSGAVSSSAIVDDIEPNDPFTAPSPDGQVKSTCTADETGVSGSTTITGGRLALQDPNPDVSGEPGEVVVTPPVDPAPGTEYAGVVANVNDYFTVVFNEQIRTADAITVNAVHMFLEGPTAVGEMIIAQSRCGVAATTANQSPVGNDDAYTTGVGQPLQIPGPGLLANDSDPEGSPLTASTIPPTPPPTRGTSCPPFPQRCPVWGSPSDPAHGSLTLNADGSFTYRPNVGFAGTDSFIYTASDTRGKSDNATVTITVSSGTHLSINDVWVSEGTGGTTVATFVVTRSGVTSGTSSVGYKTTNGTATAKADFTGIATNVTLTFAPGESSKPVAIALTGDSAWEPNETFNVVLSSPTGATIADTKGVGTIVNDDPRSYLSIDDVVVTEGNTGRNAASFTIRRSGSTSGSSTVSYKTTNGTATAGSDYTAIPLTAVTFTAGEASKVVSVSITGDTVDEANHMFTVNLSAPVGGVISDAVGTGTIVDDEGAVTPGPKTFFSIADGSVTEGNAGTTVATFVVTRSGVATGTSSVKFATANGTAVAPGDFTARALTTLSFAAGETSKSVTVNVVGDRAIEGDETFKLNLSAPVGGTLSDSSSTATIVNDEFTSFSITDVTVGEGNAGTTTATFIVNRSGNTGATATVKYVTASGTATAGSDYAAIPLTTMTFAVGETSKVVSVKVNGDVGVEPNETFKVNLSAPVGGTLSDTSGIGTIANDDLEPPTVGGDPRVDPTEFRVTTFATGLNYPYGIRGLPDGSLLVGTSRGAANYFSSSGELLRLNDSNGDGGADSTTVLYTGLPGSLTAVELAGNLVLATTSDSNGSHITVLRRGATTQDPYSRIGSVDIRFPAGWWHETYALAVRPAPGRPGAHELFFNVGSSANTTQSSETASLSLDGLSGLPPTSLLGATIYKVTVVDTGSSVTLSDLTLIATGLRNAAGIAFHPTTGDLYFEDNGMENEDGPISADEMDRIFLADVGGAVENFGFPTDYVEYRTGARIGSGGIQPLVTFQPLPPSSTNESEGPAGIAFAPPTFPTGLNDGIFLGFHGKFNLGGTANEENPFVYYDLQAGTYFHFIGNDEPRIGHLNGVFATSDSLYITDMSSTGNILSASGLGQGVVYQVKRNSSP